MSKRRIYFLVPDVKSASATVDELLLARIEALVQRHHAEADLKGIEANIPAYP